MTVSASLAIDPGSVIAPVNRRIFGSFVEHMGRCVYTGISEPSHPVADEDGLRSDVLELVRELGVTIVRYPGGNFVSGYRWEDGVGPEPDRPTRLDTAWRTVEPNTFGLDEFARWAAKAEVDIMMTLNLGTRGVPDALDLLEYANHPSGTRLSDLRRSHGRQAPYGIRTWCLGNEMDGPWQLGHKTAEEYGRLAAETARAMRMLDPDVELVLCGSSGSTMPTFGVWEEVVLGHAYELVDMISAHAYYDPETMSIESFLASGVDLDRYLGNVIAIADRVGDRIGSAKRLSLSLDEWNVWYLQRHMDEGPSLGWREAPRISEDNYTVADAVVVGSLLMTLLRRSDRVGIACLAQLVNSLGVIRTAPGGPAWRQAIYHPFALTAANAVGSVLAATVDGPGYATGEYGEVPVIDAVVTHDDVTGNLSIFVVNRATTSVGKLRVDLGELGGHQVREYVTVADDDLGAANTEREPDRVVPSPGIHARDGHRLSLELAPGSWSFARLA